MGTIVGSCHDRLENSKMVLKYEHIGEDGLDLFVFSRSIVPVVIGPHDIDCSRPRFRRALR